MVLGVASTKCKIILKTERNRFKKLDCINQTVAIQTGRDLHQVLTVGFAATRSRKDRFVAVTNALISEGKIFTRVTLKPIVLENHWELEPHI